MPAWPGGAEVGGGKKKVSCVGQNAGYAVFQSDSPPARKNFVLVSCQWKWSGSPFNYHRSKVEQ